MLCKYDILPLGLEVEYQDPSERNPNVVHSPFEICSLFAPVSVCEPVRVSVIRAVCVVYATLLRVV
jgi:hypothetical protein